MTIFRKKEEPPTPPPMVSVGVVREPSLIDRLRDRRTEKIKEANDLDREIAVLDEEITWIERNPTFNGIMRDLMRKYE